MPEQVTELLYLYMITCWTSYRVVITVYDDMPEQVDDMPEQVTVYDYMLNKLQSCYNCIWLLYMITCWTSYRVVITVYDYMLNKLQSCYNCIWLHAEQVTELL